MFILCHEANDISVQRREYSCFLSSQKICSSEFIHGLRPRVANQVVLHFMNVCHLLSYSIESETEENDKVTGWSAED